MQHHQDTEDSSVAELVLYLCEGRGHWKWINNDGHIPPNHLKMDDLNSLMWAVAVGMEKSGFYRENTEAALLDKVVNKKGEILCLGGKLE